MNLKFGLGYITCEKIYLNSHKIDLNLNWDHEAYVELDKGISNIVPPDSSEYYTTMLHEKVMSRILSSIKRI